MGVPFEGRASRLDDTLRACRTLWSEAPASFESPTVSFQDLWCLPKPVQTGGIPIWFGLKLSERNVARIVELGAGWMPLGLTTQELKDGVSRLRDAFRAAGRDPDSLGVRVGVPAGVDLERALESIAELQEAGSTLVSFALGRFVASAEQVRPFLERLGRLTA